MDRDWCVALAAVVQTFDSRIRLKLRNESDPEPWGSWLLAPVEGYLEVEGSGPYSVRRLEWIEVESTAGVAPLVSALAAAGLTVGQGPAAATDDQRAVRVAVPQEAGNSPG